MNKKIQNTCILLSLLLFSCSGSQEEKAKKTREPIEEYKTDNYDWLIGEWKRVNESSLKSTYENWMKLNDLQYEGHGYTMKGEDTLWQEYMHFAKVDEVWQMQVETPGNDTLVVFQMEMASDTSLLVLNKRHDFPQKIRYWKDDNRLEASVSNTSKEIRYSFELDKD